MWEKIAKVVTSEKLQKFIVWANKRFSNLVHDEWNKDW